jgi:alpha,alpha-trehalase
MRDAGGTDEHISAYCRVRPSSAQVPQQRRYLPGTMVLETTWQTSTGGMIVQDFLTVAPVEDAARRPDYRRASTDTGAVGALIRIATCISGRAEVAVNCAPLFNYGATGGTWSYQADGYDAMTIAAGRSASVVLSWGDARVPVSQDEAFRALNTTIDFWRDWLSTDKIPDHPRKPYIDRSALTLKALSYAPTGAIMAAATTSLPETPGGNATGTTGRPGSGTRRSCSARCIAYSERNSASVIRSAAPIA